MTAERDGTTAQQSEEGCLRRVVGLPLALLNLLTIGACYFALFVQPQGRWDEHTLTGIEAACFITAAGGALTALLTAGPVKKGLLRPWWLLPPLALAAAAVVRWVYIAQTYPQPPGM